MRPRQRMNWTVILGLVCVWTSLTGCAAVTVPQEAALRAQAMQTGTTFRQGVATAATAPLDDLNLRRQQVPEVLISSRVAPYAIRGLSTCTAIGDEIAELDDALGPDVDQSLREESAADQVANAALGTVRDTVTDFIPMRSWVRRLSGAAAHDREIQSAIRAGSVRRGFLKGLWLQRGCH
ncbi:hypothetical protein [Brevundimonas sp.]|jgi:hypothetical protein|uniref:hypothetical protein n=2 Tax=Caulobacteraceae TaxID=76892 RepID=UPI0028AD5C4A|nr:hypothetical protein [Brevundimonas sp.]